MLFAAAHVAAQTATPAEITFWESVRDSRDPVELRAYLERYPNGTFAVLARQRLSRLEPGARPSSPVASPPATQQPAPPPAVAWTMPQVGDTWTYRLREPKRRDVPTERTLTVKVTASAPAEIVDEARLDGATPLQVSNKPGARLMTEGAPIFSPYLPAFAKLPAAGSVGRVQIEDAACSGRYICDAKGRIVTRETVRVAAGTFLADKVVIEQSWRSSGATAYGGAGGRTLTIWYAPEVKRAVKFASRTTFGFSPPIEPDFELELTAFKVN